MYPKKLSDVDIAVRARVAIERKIVNRTVDDLLAAGYHLAVYDGEEFHPVTTDKPTLLDQLMETDEDYLLVYTADDLVQREGWVRFVYGNDGYDVISDYTINLEEALAGVNAYSETLED